MKIQLIGISIILFGIAWILAYGLNTMINSKSSLMIGLIIALVGLIITVLGAIKREK